MFHLRVDVVRIDVGGRAGCDRDSIPRALRSSYERPEYYWAEPLEPIPVIARICRIDRLASSSVSAEEGPIAVDGVHHVGMSVQSIDVALAFWETFLGRPARWRTTLDRPYLGRHVGYPGVSIEAAFVDLPGGGILELLDYGVEDKKELAAGTANPGNVHLCLRVSDAERVWSRAVDAGATPVVPEGPVTVDAGPNVGARAAYLRIHDGVTLELFQPPAG
jgi:catechol 2,3-dioxygenase-like lactoylglutathione lyase family enzyme